MRKKVKKSKGSACSICDKTRKALKRIFTVPKRVKK